ncbi:MAG: hypothetical protein ABR509_05640 [Candidatus Limnocylindria bacterium]
MRRPSRLSGGERERRPRRLAEDDTAPFPRFGVPPGGDPAWTLERILGPLLLAIAAAAVLGFVFLVVFARHEDPERSRPPALGLASASTPPATQIAGRSRRPLTQPEPSPTGTAAPTATARVTPIQRPSPPTPPPEAFLASVHVCGSVDGDGCVDELRRVGRHDDVVVLVVVVENAGVADTVGFQVSGPGGTADAGSVTLGFAGGGFAFVEYPTRDLHNGQYIVTATRNGAPVATADFVKRGG